MTEQVPGYVTALAFFMAILTVATMAAFAAAVVTFLVGAYKARHDDDEEEGGSGGNGGWTGNPGPPGGGGGNDRDLHTQFHAIADAVGKVIEAEKKQSEVEKVGIRC